MLTCIVGVLGQEQVHALVWKYNLRIEWSGGQATWRIVVSVPQGRNDDHAINPWFHLVNLDNVAVI